MENTENVITTEEMEEDKKIKEEVQEKLKVVRENKKILEGTLARAEGYLVLANKFGQADLAAEVERIILESKNQIAILNNSEELLIALEKRDTDSIMNNSIAKETIAEMFVACLTSQSQPASK